MKGIQGGATSVSTSEGYACAVVAGKVLCWGNYPGGLKSGNYAYVATPIKGIPSPVSSIAAGFDFTCALTSDSRVYCWGKRSVWEKQIASEDAPLPVLIQGQPADCVEIQAYHSTLVARTKGGAVFVWSDILSQFHLTQPAQVAQRDAIGIATYTSYSPAICLVLTGGTTACEEPGLYLDIARPDMQEHVDSFADRSGDIVTLARPFSTFGCVLTRAGGVKCVGDLNPPVGSRPAQGDPLDIPGLATGVSEIAVGQGFACALLGGDDVKCWGYPNDGRLGNGATQGAVVEVPVSVVGTLTPAATISATQASAPAAQCAGAQQLYDAAGSVIQEQITPDCTSNRRGAVFELDMEHPLMIANWDGTRWILVWELNTAAKCIGLDDLIPGVTAAELSKLTYGFCDGIR